ncbi:MAG TPA: hypothetical protein VE573_10290 [Nitrososphaeraceae archaeon]|nr:hypothetical protein [Nitrososphaeraceae archaeon]
MSASIAGLSQIGGIFNSSNLAAWAQAVPLIPIQTGNTTLDQGMPIFYDCIEKAVDESYSEQEPSYFHNEPTKAEVNGCYYDVFVANGDKLESANQIDASNNIDEKPVIKEEEDQNSNKNKIELEDLVGKSQQGPESFMVTPW